MASRLASAKHTAFHRARLDGGNNWQLPTTIMIAKSLRPACPGGRSVSPNQSNPSPLSYPKNTAQCKGWNR